MAGITLADAEAKLALWMTAETAVAGGQEYTIGSRNLRRANLAEIREQIGYWNSWVQKLSRGGSGGMRVRGVTPV